MRQLSAQDQAADVAALLRSRHSLLWIVTREEARVEGYLMEAAAAAKYECNTWDCGQGMADMTGRPIRGNPGTDPGAALELIADRARDESRPTRSVWVMRDLAPWLVGTIGMTTVRQVRNLARLLPRVPLASSQALVILTASADVPPELAGHATVIEWPLPDRAEIARILDSAVGVMPDRNAAMPPDMLEVAIDAAVGLTGEEAQNCFARSLVQNRRIDPATISAEKKRIIARERVLEWHDPLPGGLAAVGGLDALKEWLASRRSAYSPAARAYGLPAPKGALIVGIPGTGKSLTAKAIATSWGVPLLRLDLGALKSKFVGESEGNLRKALQVIEAIGRCVVWIDEVEKALAGASDGSADGGVSSDALGTVLSWMQERTGEAFVIATANDVSKLPPELLRKGRFDELWFVGLPTRTERLQILFAALRANGRDATTLEAERLAEIVSATDEFTGAEIAATVPDAMYAAFADGGRQITVDDLLSASATVVPLARTSADKIRALQEWAKGRARPATTPDDATAPTGFRQLDI